MKFIVVNDHPFYPQVIGCYNTEEEAKEIALQELKDSEDGADAMYDNTIYVAQIIKQLTYKGHF